MLVKLVGSFQPEGSREDVLFGAVGSVMLVVGSWLVMVQFFGIGSKVGPPARGAMGDAVVDRGVRRLRRRRWMGAMLVVDLEVLPRWCIDSSDGTPGSVLEADGR